MSKWKKLIDLLSGKEKYFTLDTDLICDPQDIHLCSRSNLSNMRVVMKLFCTYLLIFTIYIDARSIEEDDSEDEALSGMKTLKMKAAVEMPRNVFARLLHQGQFFQDIFVEQPSPDKIQFGHVCENPREWEQRFEEKDLKSNRHQGKVRWGNKNGGYGEHYWDLNHAGGVNDEEAEEE